MIPLYSEGTVFFVPLRNGGYARGIVTRVSIEGTVLFGYFFGPRLPSLEAADFDDIHPSKALLRVRFGDLGLIEGKWPIKGRLLGWDRSKWPMPDFVIRDPLGRKKPMLVRYSDIDPNRIEAVSSIANDVGLATDSMSGYGAVEIKLTKLLSP